MKKTTLAILLCLFLIGLVSADLYAQCSMCKTAVESNVNDGGNLAEGLNKGILYLMAIPYIIFTVIGVFWYKSSKAQKLKSTQA